MVVTPHPDDAEFGAAGTVAAWVRRGKEVVYVVCTNGNKGTTDPNMTPERLARMREKEQLEAAKVLGVREVVFLRHPDQGLEDTSEFRKQIVRLIRIYRPRIVITADPYRKYFWHRDHRITGQVTLDAVFPYARDRLSYPELLLDGLEPHRVDEILLWASEDVNYCFDVTDTFDLKMKALYCHVSQVGDWPRGDLENWLRERCRTAADGKEYELAESFHREEVLY
ncbi:MAG: PIG-L family deacetylase [Dehalococcoidia bacterium]|nr:PIG-L family deacetylase [Dehalococcoidia bacterium]